MVQHHRCGPVKRGMQRDVPRRGLANNVALAGLLPFRHQPDPWTDILRGAETLRIVDGGLDREPPPGTGIWREVLLDLRRRDLKQDPKLAIGDGDLGFWTALREVFATTREQRCRVHKTMNVLHAQPKSMQAKPKIKGHLNDVWQAETRAEAEDAFDFFVET